MPNQFTLPLTTDRANLQPLTFEQWRTLARDVDARAARIRAMIQAEIKRTGLAAGLGDHYPAHLAHNAMCGFESGKPWPEVNYDLARRVLWLSRDYQWRADRLAERIIARAWKRVVIHYGE